MYSGVISLAKFSKNSSIASFFNPFSNLWAQNGHGDYKIWGTHRFSVINRLELQFIGNIFGCRPIDFVYVAYGDSRKRNIPNRIIVCLDRGYGWCSLEAIPNQSHQNNGKNGTHYTSTGPNDQTDQFVQSFLPINEWITYNLIHSLLFFEIQMCSGMKCNAMNKPYRL